MIHDNTPATAETTTNSIATAVTPWVLMART
jgi:hypothetical protein